MRIEKSLLGLAMATAVVTSAQAELQELDKVVTTATLTEQEAGSVPAFTSVITADDIASTSVSSLADLLRESVGVNNFSNALGRDELQIRGLGGEYTLILVNGKRVSSGAAFAKGSDVDYNSIPLSAIERVEIIRGPMSSIYGADAIGGVLNIITKKAQDEFRSSVSAEYRNVTSGVDGDQYRLSATTQGQLSEQLSMSLAAGQNYQDAWFANESDKDADEAPKREQKKSRNLFSSFAYQLNEQQSVELDIGYNNDQRPLGTYSSGPRTREQELTRLDVTLTHKGAFDWGSTTAFIKHEDADVKDFNSSYDAPETHKTKEKNLYAKAYAAATVGINSVVAGVDYRHQNIEDVTTYMQTGKLTIDEMALFAQDDIAVTNDLKLTLGGRYDSHEIFGENFSPKAYVVYQLADGITLKGGVSEAFKAPDGSYLSPEYSVISCGGGCYLSGNPDLKAETSVNYEAGIEISQALWDLSVAWFHNDIDDLIDREITYDEVSGSATAAEWVNVAEATTKGLEASGSVDVASALRLSANYTRLITEADDGSGNKSELTGRPQHQANMSALWQASEALAATLSVNYTAGMYAEAWVNNGGWTLLQGRMPSYFRTDAGLSAQVTPALTVRGGVKNLGNVRPDEMSALFTTYELGRSYYLSGTYNF